MTGASYGQALVYTATLTSGSTSSNAFYMPVFHNEVWLGLPVMSAVSADSAIFIQGSADGVTYYRLALGNEKTSTVATTDYQIKSGTSSRWVNIPECPFSYLKVESLVAPTADIVFKIVAH